ncbi:MAG: hypothetical protein ACKO00_01675 [Crocinitomicaceae bacterium]
MFCQNQISAQTKTNKLEIEYNVSQYQKDFGVGLHLISPYFAKSKVALKLGANFQWLEHYNGSETTWTPYQNVQVGIRGRNPIVEDKVFIYGEGGIVTILTNDKFSSKSSQFGGYGLFGFEFKPTQKFAYFIELGGIGTGAIADKVVSKPIYSNGFLTNVGFRIGL